MAFSDKLTQLRKSNNVTQEELANFLNISRSTIAGYETRNREPEYRVLLDISKYFHVSLDFLLGDQLTYPSEYVPISTSDNKDVYKKDLDKTKNSSQETIDKLTKILYELKQDDLDTLLFMSEHFKSKNK